MTIEVHTSPPPFCMHHILDRTALEVVELAKHCFLEATGFMWKLQVLFSAQMSNNREGTDEKTRNVVVVVTVALGTTMQSLSVHVHVKS